MTTLAAFHTNCRTLAISHSPRALTTLRASRCTHHAPVIRAVRVPDCFAGPGEARILRPGWFYGARNSSPSQIFCAMTSASPTASQKREENLSHGLSGSFCAEGGVREVDWGVFGAAAFPTVKYLRIFSSRFAPSPRIASKSSTLLKGPYDLRICRIFSAVAGPIPGTCCNSSDVAVLRFTGRAGGFFFAGRFAAKKMRFRKRKENKIRCENDRGGMARP